jgi:acetate kinase
MQVLTVNTGSSSVRLTLYERDESGLRGCGSEHFGSEAGEPQARLRDFLDRHAHAHPRLIAHRVVHGGANLTSTSRIDAAVEAEIERLAPLAPLHNPAALAWIRACGKELGTDVRQMAVFDTAFYAQLPAVASTYALPRELAARHGLRRYGFHGIAHQALWSRWRELRPDIPDGGRVVSFQLGAGCSATAIHSGRPRDTSMGFSPLEGLMMATRCGDVDAGLLLYLQRAEGMSPAQLDSLLNDASGLLGVSGLSGDMRELLASDDPRAQLAVDLYCYRAHKYIGAYLAVLGGADAILIGGGVGENAPAIRAQILRGLDWTGIRVDEATNAAATGIEARISPGGGRPEVWVIPVDEARLLAEEALAAAAM